MLTTLSLHEESDESLGDRNARVMSEGARALEAGRIDDYLGLHSDELLFHVLGPDQVAGDYLGREALRDMIGRFKRLAGGPDVSVVVHDTLSTAKHGVWLIQFFPDPEGSPDHDTMYAVSHLHRGSISETWFVFWPKKVHISPLPPDGH